ncbi:MAG: nicotinate-nucleotide--dimethylbenzimidazole phosphoribosyltransferase [Rhodobacteraceae bacterium]|nr:nicotinate-nucleotide--dimethylbenzimidazole phosphoribosyltransferase [Paracoccaceae bacterium]
MTTPNSPFSGVQPRFASQRDLLETLSTLPTPDLDARDAAAARNATLTKPDGALGQLEKLAVWAAGWRANARPVADKAQIIVFAGNHGVTRQGVSVFPTDVTGQMVANFKAGGAAISQLADASGADLTVVPIDLETPTADFTEAPALSEEELCAALSIGWESVDPTADMIALGEMGIGNTTSAAAVARALFGGAAEDWVGRGASPDGATLDAKRRAVRAGMDRHALALRDAAHPPLEALRRFGGRELAAIAGATLRARMERIPVMLDGFICCAAVAPLFAIEPTALGHCLAAHRSAEAAHDRLLEELGLEPLLDFGLRLGEGSGAALALPILRGALACHSRMATFAEASVSTAG